MLVTNIPDCPYYLLTRASLSVTAALKKEFVDADVSEVKPAYLGALMCLWTDEGMEEALAKFGTDTGIKLIDLGRCAGLEPSTMTGLIDRMERDGLVVRAHDPNDRRVQKVMLTEKGRAIQPAVMAVLDKTLDSVFDNIPEKHLTIVTDVLRKVLVNVNKGE